MYFNKTSCFGLFVKVHMQSYIIVIWFAAMMYFVRNLLIVSSYKDYHFKQTPKNTLHTEVTFSTVFSLPSILFFEFSQQLLFIFVHACTGHAHF